MVSHCNVPAVCSQPLIDFSFPAKAMEPRQRQDLALQALAGTETIRGLATQHAVSRKFIYQQINTAQEALLEAFGPSKTT